MALSGPGRNAGAVTAPVKYLEFDSTGERAQRAGALIEELEKR
jgi:hypothetical protein